VLQQQSDYAIFSCVVPSIQAQFLEVLVLPDKFLWLIGENIDKSFQVSFGDGCFEVFDDIELDVSLAQYFDCAA
jgi:hypothetical protein